jgi:hypothetical protein
MTLIIGDIVTWRPLARQLEVSTYDLKKPYHAIKAAGWQALPGTGKNQPP